MLISICLIIISFALLVFGADITLKSSLAIANKLKIPPVIIGLTVLAFGTSLPEFVVSIKSAFEGAEGIVLGNIIGSNIANILLILGISSIISPIISDRKIFLKDYKFLFFVTALFVIISYTRIFNFTSGIIMLLILFGFIWFNYKNSHDKQSFYEDTRSPFTVKPWVFVIPVTVLGLVSIAFAAEILVLNAVKIAEILGVSEEIIGLTIIAIGTSLPELAVSSMAAFKGQSSVAIGNVVGSNIFNIVFIMGMTATVTDVSVPKQFIVYDNLFMFLSTVLLFPIIVVNGKISRQYGILFLFLFTLYIISQVLIAKGMVAF